MVLLANALNPDIVDLSFINVAQAVLGDMSVRGNAIASSLKEELNNISKLTSDTGNRYTKRNGPPILQTPARMVWDGRILNGAILGLIETQLPATDSNHEAALVHSMTQNVAESNVWQQPDMGDPQTPAQSYTWKPSTLLMDGGMPDPNDELQSAGMSSLEGLFAFDMEDLQWLEYVQ